MIKPVRDFKRQIAKVGFSNIDLARASGVSLATIYGMLEPTQQPGRRGGIRATNAWKIAKAVAARTGEDEDAVYARLFIEVDYVAPDGRRIRQTPDPVPAAKPSY